LIPHSTAAQRIAALAAFVAASAAAFAAPKLDETVLRVPVASDDGRVARIAAIEVTVFRPEGPGPFPVAVLSHGSPRIASDRRRAGRIRFEAQSRAFLAMGYAVVVPTRRGYGDSQGDWAESYGTCQSPDYYHAGLESARDILAALAAARTLPGLDGGHVVLVGQSAGGFGSVAASTLAVPGIVGVVNFAGGRGSQAPQEVCSEARLVEAMQRYGAASRVPQLWVYSPNDQYFRPALARRMHAAFTASGGRAEFLEAPSVGADGHGYFGHVADWRPRVQAFLEREVKADEPLMRAGHSTAGTR
jgi:dienelactone hydrolase